MSHFFADSTFWLAVSFFIFIALFGKMIIKVIFSSLDQRKDSVQQQIEESGKLREEAQKMLAKYEQKQRNAQKEGEKILTKAKETVSTTRQQAFLNLEQDLRRRENAVAERILQAEKDFYQQIQDQAITAAIQIATHILREVDPEKENRILNDSIEKIHPPS